MAFEPIEVSLRKKPPAIYEVNPKGTVPVLVVGELKITESLVICEYADDVSGARRLLPGGPEDRARARLWAERLNAQLAPPLGKHAHAQDEAAAAAAIADLRAALETLEAQVPPEGFIAGAFSLADVVAAPFLLRLPTGIGPLPARLGAYVERLRERPTIAKHTTPHPPASWPHALSG